MLLTLNNVHAAPWGTPLLRHLEFDLGDGEILGVLGPNGAGKTTLLNLLCGAVPCSDGSVHFGGRPLSAWPVQARARAQAVLPQHSSLNFPYTVEEVVLLGRTPHASGAQQDRQIVAETLAATDTSALRQRLYTQLSGGEKQRVQLARVFAQVWRSEDSPQRLLLLDEPTSALDLAHQQLVMEGLHALAERGCAIVLVAHDFNLVARHADRVLVLHNGRQFAHGSPLETLDPALFRDVFAVETQFIHHPNQPMPIIVPA